MFSIYMILKDKFNIKLIQKRPIDKVGRFFYAEFKK